MTVGVILVNASGEVLMQLRDDIPTISDPGRWAVPGGGVDEGESLEAAVRREILEETGYHLADIELVFERDLDRGNGFIEHQAYFLSRYDGIQPLHCLEGQAIEFISPTRLLDLKLTPGLGPIVVNAFTCSRVSEGTEEQSEPAKTDDARARSEKSMDQVRDQRHAEG